MHCDSCFAMLFVLVAVVYSLKGRADLLGDAIRVVSKIVAA
jgi:hypothetical protein